MLLKLHIKWVWSLLTDRCILHAACTCVPIYIHMAAQNDCNWIDPSYMCIHKKMINIASLRNMMEGWVLSLNCHTHNRVLNRTLSILHNLNKESVCALAANRSENISYIPQGTEHNIQQHIHIHTQWVSLQ